MKPALARTAVAAALAGAALLVAGLGVSIGQSAPWQDEGWHLYGTGYTQLALFLAPAGLVLALVLAGSSYVVGGRALVGGSLFLVAIPGCLYHAFVGFDPDERLPLLAPVAAGFLLLCAATATWVGYRRLQIRGDEYQVHEAVASAVRCYKSRGAADPVIYAQEEDQWRTYARGRLVRESAGAIPTPILARSEEISRRQAEDLLHLGRAKAQATRADRQQETREETARREAHRNQERSALRMARLRFTAGLVLAVGISVGGFFAARHVRGYYFPYLVAVGAGPAAALVSLLVWHPRSKDLRHIIIPWVIAWVLVTLALWGAIASFMLQPDPSSG